MNRGLIVACLGAALLTGACASIPTGPSVMVLPGTGKNFDQFQFDDAACRQWASQQVGITNETAATNSTVSGAAIGTLLGAGTFALIAMADTSVLQGWLWRVPFLASFILIIVAVFIRLKLKTLDPSIKYVVCCDTGRRSSAGAFILNERGFQTYVLKGGLNLTGLQS